MSSRQMVIFSINEEDFGIDITQVKSIEKVMEIFKVPNTPEFMEGLINLRGSVHPVINLRKRFNLPACDFDENTKIVIVNANSTVVGFIVDEVKEILKVDEEEIENTPKVLTDLNRKYINGIAKLQDRIVLILDTDIILSMNTNI